MSSISVDDKRRTLLWLWGRTNTPPVKGWGSVITMPRILAIDPDGYLQQRPAPEFETLRGAVQMFPGNGLEKTFVAEGVAIDAAEIDAEFSGNGVFGLELRRSPEGKPGIVVSVEGGYVNVGRARAFVGNAGRYRIRVFLDKRCIEVFVNDGAAAAYNWFDSGPKDLGVAAFGKITAVPSVGTGGMPMNGARFSLEHFQA